jgi:hypothetical protein
VARLGLEISLPRRINVTGALLKDVSEAEIGISLSPPRAFVVSSTAADHRVRVFDASTIYISRQYSQDSV